MNEKSILRKNIIELRDKLSIKEREIAEIRLLEILLKDDWYKRSESILCFASYGSEISTFAFMKMALSDGKRLFLPKVVGDSMLFYRVDNIVEDLAPGYKAIPEPLGNTELFSADNNVLVIMPGVAFDKNGNRLGYGGGFYDRYFSDKNDLQKCSIAIGFKCQEVVSVPTEEHDLRPGKIVLV